MSEGHALIHSNFTDESLSISVPSASFEESRIHVAESNPRARLRDERMKSDLPILNLHTFKESGQGDTRAIADTNR